MLSCAASVGSDVTDAFACTDCAGLQYLPHSALALIFENLTFSDQIRLAAAGSLLRKVWMECRQPGFLELGEDGFAYQPESLQEAGLHAAACETVRALVDRSVGVRRLGGTEISLFADNPIMERLLTLKVLKVNARVLHATSFELKSLLDERYQLSPGDLEVHLHHYYRHAELDPQDLQVMESLMSQVGVENNSVLHWTLRSSWDGGLDVRLLNGGL